LRFDAQKLGPSETLGTCKLTMSGDALREELAKRKAEADRGEASAAVSKLLERIPDDFSASIDNSHKIALADELLGLTDEPLPGIRLRAPLFDNGSR
jgi:hypothetical protein